METLFSREMLANCVAPTEEVDEAKKHGKILASESVDGKITAYLWRDKIYVVEVEIMPEKRTRKLKHGYNMYTSLTPNERVPELMPCNQGKG